MRRDREIADTRTIRQDHRHGRGLAAPAAPGFEEMGNGAGAQGVARQGQLDRDRQLLWPIVVEQRL
jgi:hypothetical protein